MALPHYLVLLKHVGIKMKEREKLLEEILPHYLVLLKPMLTDFLLIICVSNYLNFLIFWPKFCC